MAEYQNNSLFQICNILHNFNVLFFIIILLFTIFICKGEPSVTQQLRIQNQN